MKKKARVIQKAPKAGKLPRQAVTAAVHAAVEKSATSEFRKAINKAMKQYATTIKNLAGR